MSLIQHVTQQEGTDREEALVDLFLPPVDRQISRQDAAERRLSLESAISGAGFLSAQGKSVRRVISYDIIPKPEELAPGEEPGGLTPYKVPTGKRIAQVIVTVLACWFASGIVFGFAALKPILIKEGVFSNLCTPEEVDADVEVCFEQDLRLNFFFFFGIDYGECFCSPRRYLARSLWAQALLPFRFFLSRAWKYPNESRVSDRAF